MSIDIDAIRQRLSIHFIPYEEGRRLRNQLKAYAKMHYVPRHSAESRLAFIEDNEHNFTENGAQSGNHPYVYTLFTIPSQHVMGDSYAECVDNAIDVAASIKGVRE